MDRTTLRHRRSIASPATSKMPPVPSAFPPSVLPARPVFALLLFLLAFLAPPPTRAAEIPEARKQLLAGDYRGAIHAAEEALRERPRTADWHRILIEGLLAVGRYPEADAAATNALALAPRSLPVRWLAREAFRRNGRPLAAETLVEETVRAVSQQPWAYREPEDLVMLGRFVLILGADPKDILDRFYATAKRLAPELRDTYLAAGDLALAKHDYALAGRQFDEGLKRFADDPDLLHGRARAFLEGDRKEMSASLEAALAANPRHTPSLLLFAEHQIDAEDYDAARKTLAGIHEINPHHPEAWAFAAVIAHLRHDATAESVARSNALRYWPTDPAVPHRIGLKLAQKYRFAEGAALQREALRFDPGYLPAQAQLASDLLRLGDEAEGWDLVQKVHGADAYDVTAYNLATLHDTMAAFVTVTNAHFVVRMIGREAEIYGPRVLALLERARSQLVPRYGAELAEPTIVEIFPDPKDFGVRTFGMPDNPGYLGVCFGRVITANSPASSRGSPVNWEAVLWHEFCHVVTLQLTANRMPRWLSEGISVYEERQASPAWGEQINPRYREMLLGDDLTPIGRLSAAFLIPKSPVHLQFAYYESSLVIEFLVDRFGFPKLRAILADLRNGTFINDAIEKHTAPLDSLEKDFATFARARARALAPELDWAKREDEALPPGVAALAEKLPGRPDNYYDLRRRALVLLEQKKWAEAKEPLTVLARAYPSENGADSANALLAQVHRALGETAEERQALARWAEVDGEAVEAYRRLMELDAAAADWPAVVRNAERYLAVNPLVPVPHRQLAAASEATGRPADAVASYQALLRLDPANPPALHYDLARLLRPTDPPAARRHVLEALQDVPRHRAALALLLDLGPSPPGAAGTNPPPTAPATTNRWIH